MSFEIDFFRHYFNAISNDDQQEIAELETAAYLEGEFRRIIMRIDAFSPAKKRPHD